MFCDDGPAVNSRLREKEEVVPGSGGSSRNNFPETPEQSFAAADEIS